MCGLQRFWRGSSILDLVTTGKRVLLLERAFNAVRGVRRRDEKPPERMFSKPVSDGQYKGEILHPDRFEKMLSDYYELRGCDEEGIPTCEAFKELGLTAEWSVFKNRMKEGKS